MGFFGAGVVGCRPAEATDRPPPSPGLHEDRLREPQEPGPRLLRLLWSGDQRCQETGQQA